MIADYLEVNGWRWAQAQCFDLTHARTHACMEDIKDLLYR